jgi:hypothetical protein
MVTYTKVDWDEEISHQQFVKIAKWTGLQNVDHVKVQHTPAKEVSKINQHVSKQAQDAKNMTELEDLGDYYSEITGLHNCSLYYCIPRLNHS